MAAQIPIKVLLDSNSCTCGLAQFTSSDSVAIAAGGTGLTSQGICEFAQPGIQAVACKTTYIGICAGKSEGAADENTYVGYGAGQNVTTGCYHTIIGSNAGDAITTCSSTVLIGFNAGTSLTFGDRNTVIGTAAGVSMTTASDNTLVGFITGCVTTGDNNTGLGACALALNTVGVDNVAIGTFAGKTQVASGCNNTYIGSQAGVVALCRDNTLVGAYAGKAQTTATCNVMLGGCVGYGVVGGAGNVYLGYKSGLVNTSGNDNVFIGKASGAASTASCCLIIGNGTCDIITGSFNTPSLTLDADTFVSNGKGVVIGHTSQLTVASVAAEFQYLGTGGADRTMVLGSWVASTGNANVSFIKSRNATIGSNTIVNDDDPLGSIFFYGDDGTDFNSQAASIIGYVDGTPGTGDMPGRLVFSTTADGAESATERMRIDAAGKVGIGTTAPDGTLHVFTSTAGSVTAHAYADDLVIENGGPAGISIFADDNPVTIAMGGASATNLGGYIQYDYDGGSDFMIFATDVTEAMRIDCDQNVNITGGNLHVANGQGVVVGHTAQMTSPFTSEFQILGTASTDSGMFMGQWSNNAGGPILGFLKSRSGTIGTSTVVQDDDTVMQITAYAADGTDTASQVGSIIFSIDGTPGSNDTPGRLTFQTTADGDAAGTERMRIDSAGRIGIGTATPLNCSLLTIMSDDLSVGTQKGGLITLSQNGYVCSLLIEGCSAIYMESPLDATGMFIGTDSVGCGAYLQSTEQAVSWTTRPLLLNPLGGDVHISCCAIVVCTGGEVTKPRTPAFLARAKTGDYSQNNQTGTSEVHIMQYCNERFDQGADFGGACKVFTAPVGGKYFLNMENGPNGIAGCVYALLVIYTSNATYVHSFNQCAAAVSGGYASVNLTVLADMDAGDIACTGILVAGDSKTIGVGGASDYFWFSGALIA